MLASSSSFKHASIKDKHILTCVDLIFEEVEFKFQNKIRTSIQLYGQCWKPLSLSQTTIRLKYISNRKGTAGENADLFYQGKWKKKNQRGQERKRWRQIYGSTSHLVLCIVHFSPYSPSINISQPLLSRLDRPLTYQTCAFTLLIFKIFLALFHAYYCNSTNPTQQHNRCSTDTCINKSCGIEKVYQYHVYFFWKKSCIPVLQPFCCWRISAIQNIIKKSASHTVSELHNIVHAFKIQWSTMNELRVVKNYSSSHLQCCQGSRITLHLNRFPHRLHKKKKKTVGSWRSWISNRIQSTNCCFCFCSIDICRSLFSFSLRTIDDYESNSN